MDDYGSVLGRLACMFIRITDMDDEFGDHQSGLTMLQKRRMQDLKEGLVQDASDNDMHERFQAMLKQLFFWHESRRLMDILDCPIQLFLVYASIEKGAKGFIGVREIGRLIAKLVYGIRCCIFQELMARCDSELADGRIDRELGGLMIYAQEMLQTPFGFLAETMHFAASVAGEAGALPQVSWLGIESGMSLAIHGKRVELEQLRKLCLSLLREAQVQLDFKVKMGIKTVDWNVFEAEDDLTNVRDGYSFVSSPNNGLVKDKLCLLQGFMANGATRSFFTRGINGNVILWQKDRCVEWLKRCKKLLEMLAVLCHLLGGQPARGTELATLRWRNSVDEQRGVYWANETIMLLAMYSKTRSITRHNRLIPR
jgi:hypothetical protein